MAKVAVVLVNLGGPDSLEAVEPFLFNLFDDPAIIGLPGFLRTRLARFISRKRAPKAQGIYEHLGGRSPLMDYTTAQAAALDSRLQQADPSHVYKSFIAMRYWHPMTEEVVGQVKDWGAEQVLFLPLYPQFSTTTTGSSLKKWQEEAKKQGLQVTTQAICCYPTEKHFIAAHVRLLRENMQAAGNLNPDGVRILFSAHGLPEKVIRKGDPYQWQVEQTAALVMEHLSAQTGQEWDWNVCYQSRVGPLKWIGPSTEEEIARAGVDGKTIILVPVAFVSEHSETLVELDVEYKHLAEAKGVPGYVRVPTLNSAAEYVEALAGMVISSVRRGMKDGAVRPHFGHLGKETRLCPKNWKQCACNV